MAYKLLAAALMPTPGGRGPGRRRRGGERPPRLSAELVEWGMPRTAILVDARPRTTRENAVETERILTARGARSLLLVTSALHMPRGGLVYYRLRGWTR